MFQGDWYLLLTGGAGTKIERKNQRSGRTARVEPLWRAGKKSQNIGLKRVKINNEIKFCAAHVLNSFPIRQLPNSPWSVAQCNPVNNQSCQSASLKDPRSPTLMRRPRP
jgi:hypothetical protein